MYKKSITFEDELKAEIKEARCRTFILQRKLRRYKIHELKKLLDSYGLSVDDVRNLICNEHKDLICKDHTKDG